MRQDEWVTRMARLAATDYGADWVINADADEFWWPRGGSLKDVLASIPERYGVVRGCWRHFLPRPRDGRVLRRAHDRPALRSCASRATSETIFHAHQKVAHRADPDVSIEPGNHDATGPRLAPLRGWHPLEVLHFSLRSPAQLERKAVRGLGGVDAEPARADPASGARRRGARDGPRGRVLRLVRRRRRRARARARRRARSRSTRGCATRSARSATEATERFACPTGACRAVLSFPQPAHGDDAIYASEASVLADIDGVVRAERRVDALEERCSLERGRWQREPVGRRVEALRDIDWRRDEARHDPARARRGRHRRGVARLPPERGRGLRGRDGQPLAGRHDRRSSSATRARGTSTCIREQGEDLRQDEWVTRMARLAATDFGADWVINSDADEFWWPRGASLPRDARGRPASATGRWARSCACSSPRPGATSRSPSG